jgi:hypothetical protein
MSINSKKSIAWTTVLILFGVLAMFGGEKWLILLIPAAIFIWFGTGPALRSGRN